MARVCRCRRTLPVAMIVERRKGGALSQQQIFDTGTWQNGRNHQRAIHFARDIFCAVNSDIDPFLD